MHVPQTSNSLTPSGDLDQIFPFNIIPESNFKVAKIKEIITN